MKRVFAVFAALLLLAGPASAARPSSRTFPTWGVCTGDYVRMREKPNTKAAIVEPYRLSAGQRVTVLGEKQVRGDTWYKIEHPDEEGVVWVFGKYIDIEPEEPEPEPRKPSPKPKREPEDEGEFLTESARKEAAGDWKDSYPETGVCVGDGVRLREDPDTESEIVGQLKKGEQIILLEETSVDGRKWYAADHPTEEGTAWVSARYIETFKGYEIGTPAYNAAIRVMMDFGITPEKARVLLGDPDRELEDKRKKRILDYGGYRIAYVGGRLQNVEVFERGTVFGGIQVGDPVSRLTDALGEPTEEARGDWLYEATPRVNLTFTAANGKIVHMVWNRDLDD